MCKYDSHVEKRLDFLNMRFSQKPEEFTRLSVDSPNKKEIVEKFDLSKVKVTRILDILEQQELVVYVDKDQKIIQTCIENYNLLKEVYELGEGEFITNDISLFDQEVDIVVQNPPFGTKKEHADKLFLEQAFVLTKVVYSMHKWSTKAFVEAISSDHGFEITGVWRYEFPIKKVFSFHKKPVKNVDVGLWRMEKESEAAKGTYLSNFLTVVSAFLAFL